MDEMALLSASHEIEKSGNASCQLGAPVVIKKNNKWILLNELKFFGPILFRRVDIPGLHMKVMGDRKFFWYNSGHPSAPNGKSYFSVNPIGEK